MTKKQIPYSEWGHSDGIWYSLYGEIFEECIEDPLKSFLDSCWSSEGHSIKWPLSIEVARRPTRKEIDKAVKHIAGNLAELWDQCWGETFGDPEDHTYSGQDADDLIPVLNEWAKRASMYRLEPTGQTILVLEQDARKMFPEYFDQ